MDNSAHIKRSGKRESLINNSRLLWRFFDVLSPWK